MAPPQLITQQEVGAAKAPQQLCFVSLPLLQYAPDSQQRIFVVLCCTCRHRCHRTCRALGTRSAADRRTHRCALTCGPCVGVGRHLQGKLTSTRGWAKRPGRGGGNGGLPVAGHGVALQAAVV